MILVWLGREEGVRDVGRTSLTAISSLNFFFTQTSGSYWTKISNTDLSFAGHKFSVENLASGLACSYGGTWTAFGWENVLFWSGFFSHMYRLSAPFHVGHCNYSGCPVCLHCDLDPQRKKKLRFNTAGWVPSCRANFHALCAAGFSILKGAARSIAGVVQARCLCSRAPNAVSHTTAEGA